MNKIKTLITLLFFSTAFCIAQTEKVEGIKDSTNISQIEGDGEFEKKVTNFEKERFADSIRRADLEARIQNLSTTKSSERKELEAELNQYKIKEEALLISKKKQIEALKKTTKGYPVDGFHNDTLFLIYTRLGSFSPAERAETITNRIKKLPFKIDFSENSLKIEELETTVDIIYEEQIIISITDFDALWLETSPVELAQKYKTKIVTEVTNYKSETSLFNLLKSLGLAFIALIIIIIIVRYILRLFKWSRQKIQRQKKENFKPFIIKGYTLLDIDRQVTVLLFANKIIKWFTVCLSIYIALPIIFGFFPQTENLAKTLFGYILNPLKGIFLAFWNYLPNLFTIIVIVFVFRFVLKGLNFLKIEIEEERLTFNGFYPYWAKPTYQLVRVLVIAFAFVVIFKYLPGSDSPVFQGISVFLGFLFTFGSAGSLSNIIAGLVLTYMRLFKIGDRVKIGDVMGDVIEKSSLVTRIRTPKNEIISIPNSSVMSSHTINYSSDAPEKGLIIHTTVTIGYDIPWKEMHTALIEAALRTDLVQKDPMPFVLQTSLEDFYVAYQINAYIQEANKQAAIYSHLHQNIQDVCNERGIEILSPHYRAARDGNHSTIPTDYLPKDYKSPGFNVNTAK
ncbi:ion channel [Patiriisocius marinistellae]|uniref:Ion channel n=1 Tax=Patiriisocius marinistellae TaxID=2494560 RepID=A0A5J4FX38_9FLAO|nr:mechanosensitive ion channel family protein [Patiriisocius marinistellae]GEQ84639.1 ion channel [Patiriisocius marinistellae]